MKKTTDTAAKATVASTTVAVAPVEKTTTPDTAKKAAAKKEPAKPAREASTSMMSVIMHDPVKAIIPGSKADQTLRLVEMEIESRKLTIEQLKAAITKDGLKTDPLFKELRAMVKIQGAFKQATLAKNYTAMAIERNLAGFKASDAQKDYVFVMPEPVAAEADDTKTNTKAVPKVETVAPGKETVTA